MNLKDLYMMITIANSLINNSVNVVYEDSKRRLWVGTDEGGLNLFTRETKSFIHYTTKQGLPDNTIVGILEDDKGDLWISSHDGISKATIDSTNGSIKTYVQKLYSSGWFAREGI